MNTYTTRPSTTWAGYVDILEDGRLCMTCPEKRAQAAIEEIKQSNHKHWTAIAARTDERLVIADGSAYSIGSPGDYPKGFGGDRWHIVFFDGRTVTTDSLWHMGKVPTEWREQLPDNAKLEPHNITLSDRRY